MARYIFVTGGVVSSLGKGLSSASLAYLLKSQGYKVRLRKMDPYLNVDPGTMSPFQHGEVFVTDDGAETDLDLGHSQNRDSGETDKLINAKIKAATQAGLKVIFCIGETLGQKRKKITKKILSKQIIVGLQKIKKRKNIVIAYEPVWSIGTGLIPKADDLYNTINFIKKKVRNIKVLYGGSVNPKNINKLKLIKNIDGFLIGGASQDPKKFIDIIKKTYN